MAAAGLPRTARPGTQEGEESKRVYRLVAAGRASSLCNFPRLSEIESLFFSEMGEGKSLKTKGVMSVLCANVCECSCMCVSVCGVSTHMCAHV